VVRIPSRRPEGPATKDDDGAGRIDERDSAPVPSQPVAASQTSDPTTYRSANTPAGTGGVPDAERPADYDPNQRYRTDRPVTSAGTPGEPATVAGAGADYREPAHAYRTDDEATVVAGPRPRASLLATLSLILGVAGVLFVLTGALAAHGIALGAVALLLSFGGLSATGRRHVAGKSDALLGLVLGLAAVVLGILAVTGQFVWPNTDGDTVQRFRDWLDAQTVDRF
jgi:hypothetical protein